MHSALVLHTWCCAVFFVFAFFHSVLYTLLEKTAFVTTEVLARQLESDFFCTNAMVCCHVVLWWKFVCRFTCLITCFVHATLSKAVCECRFNRRGSKVSVQSDLSSACWRNRRWSLFSFLRLFRQLSSNQHLCHAAVSVTRYSVRRNTLTLCLENMTLATYLSSWKLWVFLLRRISP